MSAHLTAITQVTGPLLGDGAAHVGASGLARQAIRASGDPNRVPEPLTWVISA